MLAKKIPERTSTLSNHRIVTYKPSETKIFSHVGKTIFQNSKREINKSKSEEEPYLQNPNSTIPLPSSFSSSLSVVSSSVIRGVKSL